MDKVRQPHKQRTIEKIQNAKVLERLIKHFNGDLKLSQTQITVGINLIKKYIPDLKAIEHGGEMTHNVDVNQKSAGIIAKAIREEITKSG